MDALAVHEPDETGIGAATRALASGRLVVHPTSTIPSLTGDAASIRAIRAARVLKVYTEPRPFLCLVGDRGSARLLAGAWPPAARCLAAAFWPGPLTLVVAAGDAAPEGVVRDGTVAVRPAVHAVARRLVRAWGGPLFSTSVNRRGEAAARTIGEAIANLADAPADVRPQVVLSESSLEPSASAGVASTVVDVSGSRARLIREGAIPATVLRAVWPDLEM